MNIKQICGPTARQVENIIKVWEESVKATHLFLTPGDIQNLKPFVEKTLWEIEQLLTLEDGQGVIRAFMGIEGQKLEMLFIEPAFAGRGFGRKLLDFAVNELNVKYVDVNEQNPNAVGFYKHMGFRVFKRSEKDGQGNPLPILHMKL